MKTVLDAIVDSPVSWNEAPGISKFATALVLLCPDPELQAKLDDQMRLIGLHLDERLIEEVSEKIGDSDLVHLVEVPQLHTLDSSLFIRLARRIERNCLSPSQFDRLAFHVLMNALRWPASVTDLELLARVIADRGSREGCSPYVIEMLGPFPKFDIGLRCVIDAINKDRVFKLSALRALTLNAGRWQSSTERYATYLSHEQLTSLSELAEEDDEAADLLVDLKTALR
ncbi:MAG: hypothetical protein ACFCVE_14105 [Phycisphaerae bacterium]